MADEEPLRLPSPEATTHIIQQLAIRAVEGECVHVAMHVPKMSPIIDGVMRHSTLCMFYLSNLILAWNANSFIIVIIR